MPPLFEGTTWNRRKTTPSGKNGNIQLNKVVDGL